jgi:biotin carboxyl carrier protein
MEAKVLSLLVRPIQSADLSFNIAGAIGHRFLERAKLGKTITSFNYGEEVIKKLNSSMFGDDGNFGFGPQKVQEVFSSSVLYSLRNDTFSSLAEQAILQRKMAYLQRYKYKDKILAALKRVYPDNDLTSEAKLQRLRDLAALSVERRAKLKQAYDDKAQKGVFTTLETTRTSTGKTVSRTNITAMGTRNEEHEVAVRASNDGDVKNNADHKIQTYDTIPLRWDPDPQPRWETIRDGDLNFPAQETTVDPSAVTETTTTRGQDFRYPSVDSDFREIRHQIDLADELLAQEIFSLGVPQMGTILESELGVLNEEVFKAIVRYSQTYLYSPINGRIVAIYKDVGESVQAGEAVVRVENDERILLVGNLRIASAIELQASVTINCKNVFESEDHGKITGELVAVRGHDADDNEWEVIIEAKNEVELIGPGRTKKLPINYHFDKKDTYVTFN